MISGSSIRQFILVRVIIIIAAVLSVQGLERQSPLPISNVLQQTTCLSFQRQDFLGHTSEIFGVAFSPDGKYILTGSNDWTARLWNIQTGRVTRTFIGH